MQTTGCWVLAAAGIATNLYVLASDVHGVGDIGRVGFGLGLLILARMVQATPSAK